MTKDMLKRPLDFVISINIFHVRCPWSLRTLLSCISALFSQTFGNYQGFFLLSVLWACAWCLELGFQWYYDSINMTESWSNRNDTRTIIVIQTLNSHLVDAALMTHKSWSSFPFISHSCFWVCGDRLPLSPLKCLWHIATLRVKDLWKTFITFKWWVRNTGKGDPVYNSVVF